MNTEKQNNFTIVRVMLATLVMLGHFKILAGSPTPFLFSFADLAVEAFFVVSGFLVAGSFDRMPVLVPFYLKRFFRIYPLYFFVVVAQALAMLAFFSNELGEIAISALRYLGVNLIFANFLQHDIGGLLANSPNPGINPSLWTLKVEVGFYLIVPFVHRLVKRFGWSVLGVIFFASTIYFLHYRSVNAELAKQLPGQLRFFVVGMAFFYYGRKLQLSRKVGWAAFLLCLSPLMFKNLGLSAVLHPLAVGFVVFFATMRLPPIQFKSDISFGIYLIHGPVIQLLILSGYYVDSWFCLLAVCAFVVLLACLADHLIERPGIKIGARLVRKLKPANPARHIGENV